MSEQYTADETTLAADATEAYNAGKLNACWTHMRKLASTRSSDSRVLANKALVDLLWRCNSSRSDDYITQLHKASSLAGSPIIAKTNSPYGVNAEVIQPASPTAKSSVIALHYNYALAMFHRRQFGLADRLLIGLLGLMDADAKPASVQFPIRVGFMLCQKIFLLWLDVCLCLQRPQRVYEIASHWLHQLDLVTKSVGKPTEQELVTMLTGIARPLRVFRLRACLLTGKIKQAEHELALLSESDGDVKDSQWDTKKSIEYATTQLTYLQNNRQITITNLNAILARITSSPSSEALWEAPLVWNNLSLCHFRAGEMGLARFKLRKALRITDRLTASVTEGALNGRGSSGGGSDQSSSLTQLMRTTPLDLLNASCHSALLYNVGVQFLLNQNPGAAFNAFLAVVKTYPQNPRLWLRLAECCIRVHCPDNLSDWRLDSRANCLAGTIGEGSARKILIGPQKEEPKKPWIESSTLAAPTLEFAALCLRNARFLLPRPPSDFVVKGVKIDELPVDRQRSELIKWANKQTVSTQPAVQPLTGLALIQVTSATLLTSAYVALRLNNPIEAMHCANQVICDTGPKSPASYSQVGSSACPAGTASCLPGCDFGWIGLLAPPAHRYLAKLYLSEAHLIMDDLPTACSRLIAKDNVGGVESLSVFSLHSIKTYQGLDSSGCASLAPAYLLPQTHPQCGQKTTESAINSTADLQQRQKDQQCAASEAFLPDGPMAASNSRQLPDFPATGDQAIGVQFFNLAVCCAIRGDFSVARQLLENAAPALLLKDLDPTRQSNIAHRTEELFNILYPGAAAPSPPPRTPTNNYHLPAHFIRLWLYVELCEGRIDHAIRFARAHCGHVAYANRLIDIAPKPREEREEETEDQTAGSSAVQFQIGGDAMSPFGEPQQTPIFQQAFEVPVNHNPNQRRFGMIQQTLRQSSPQMIVDPPAAPTQWDETDWPPL